MILRVEIKIFTDWGEDLEWRTIRPRINARNGIRYISLEIEPEYPDHGTLTIEVDADDLTPEDWEGEDMAGVLEFLRCELGEEGIEVPTSYKILGRVE